jgi:hypothetical protein
LDTPPLAPLLVSSLRQPLWSIAASVETKIPGRAGKFIGFFR